MKVKHWIIIIALLIIDQITKMAMINKNIELIPNILGLNYTVNYRAAFGMGERVPIIVTSIVFIILIFAFIVIKKKDIENYIPFALILSGSFSNLIDRLFRGYVIDYINLKFINYPVFNLADTFIFIGIFILVYFIITKKSYIKI